LTLEIDTCSVSHSINYDEVHKTGFYIGSSSNGAEDIVPLLKNILVSLPFFYCPLYLSAFLTVIKNRVMRFLNPIYDDIQIFKLELVLTIKKISLY
jgi:hypothetical protein